MTNKGVICGLDDNIRFDCEKKSLDTNMSHFHAHPLYEMFHLKSGKGFLYAENRVIPLREKSLYLISPHVLHKVTTDPGTPYHRSVILFDANVFSHFVDRRVSEQIAGLFTGNAMPAAVHIPIDASAYESVDFLFSEIAREIDCEEDAYIAMAVVHVFEILVLSMRAVRHGAGDADGGKYRSRHPVIGQIIDTLNRGINEDISLKDLEEQLHLSRFHIIRLFRQELGITPYYYLMCKRISTAQELLSTSSISVTDIALSLQFSDASHFSRAFKRQTGVTRSTFRNMRTRMIMA